MAQCQGKTKKGERCKRDSREGTDFCAIHQDQEVRERKVAACGEEWNRDDYLKAALGFAVIGALILFRFRR